MLNTCRIHAEYISHLCLNGTCVRRRRPAGTGDSAQGAVSASAATASYLWEGKTLGRKQSKP
eukprot:10196571-Heterocapsa_arctica.AAC.1